MSRQASPDQSVAAAPDASSDSSAEHSGDDNSSTGTSAAPTATHHPRGGPRTSRDPHRQVSQMSQLPPPPPFLAHPGVPPIPWELWEQMFTNYIRATGGRDHSPGRKESILQTCLGAEGQRKTEPEPVDWEDVRRRTEEAQDRTKLRYDASHRATNHKLNVGDWVVIRLPGIIKKGQSKYSRPIQITKVNDKSATMSDGRQWSVDRLATSRPPKQSDETSVSDGEDTASYEEEIEMRTVRGTAEEGDKEQSERIDEGRERAAALEEMNESSPANKRNRQPPCWWRDYQMGQ